jgi:hypothetical protein
MRIVAGPIIRSAPSRHERPAIFDQERYFGGARLA